MDAAETSRQLPQLPLATIVSVILAHHTSLIKQPTPHTHTHPKPPMYATLQLNFN